MIAAPCFFASQGYRRRGDRRPRPRWPGLRPALLGVPLLFVGLALLAPAASAQNLVNQNPQPPFTFQNTPSITLDAPSGNTVVAYNDDPWMSAAQSIGISFSPDGGVTWIDCPPLPSVWGTWEADPSIVSDHAGFIYAGMSSCDQFAPGVPGTPINSGVYAFVSTDGGQTFPTLVPVSVQGGLAPTTPWETKPKLEVDDDPTSPFHQRVYSIWERDLPIPNPNQWQYSDAWFAWSPPGGMVWTVLPAPLNDGTPFDEVLWPDPAVATNGDVGVAWLDSPVAVWPTGAPWPAAPQGQIWFDRSTDGGQTFGQDVPVVTFWTVPAPMTDGLAQPTRTAFSYPSVEYDPTNASHVAIVYAGDPDTGPLTDARVDLGDQPPGNNDAWLVSPFLGTSNISGGSAYVHAMWVDHRGPLRDVYFNRAPAGTQNWALTDILVSTTPAGDKRDAGNADMVSDAISNVYVAWDQDVMADYVHGIYFNRSTNEGAAGSWLAQAIPLDHLGRRAWAPALSCDHNNVCAAWINLTTDGMCQELYVNYSTNGGATWQPNEIPVRTGQWVLAHDIAQAGANVYLVWEEATGGGVGSVIYFSRSTNYGAAPWSAPIRLDAAPATTVAFAPKICCDGTNVYATWVDDRSAGQYDVYFTWSNNYGVAGSWFGEVRLANQVAPGACRNYYSQMACGRGNVYVVYESDRAQPGTTHEEIWINCSLGGGANWIGEQRLDLGDPAAPIVGRHSCHPRLAVGGTDVDLQVFVAWMDDRNSPIIDSGFDIYGNHSPDGGQTWLNTDYRLDIGDQPGQNDSWYPHVGWVGGPHYLWRDERNGAGDVYANLFGVGPDEGDIFYIDSFDGGQTWNYPPLRVNDDPPGSIVDQSHPWLDFKPNGIADVVWYDNRNDPANDFLMETYFAALLPGSGAFAPNVPVAPQMAPVLNWSWTGDYIWIDVDAANAHVALCGSWTDPAMGDVYYTWVPNPPLPQPGACCTPSRGCEFVTEPECLALGGEFLGAGIPCDPDPCTEGVCCVADVCYVITEADCWSVGGVWHPERDDCDPNPCGGDYADHDVGMCILTVTDMGILGFTDDTQAEGSGFIYPVARQGENHLFIGGVWVGLDPTYVANRDYSADPEQEWQVATDPDGQIWIDYGGVSDQDMTAGYTDSSAAAPRGLYVQQESWAFSRAGSPAIDDFVILNYTVTNRSATPQEDIYIGVFLDVDIADYSNNAGWADPSLNLICMHEAVAEPPVYVGLRLLQNELDEPPLANVSLVDNATYVYPQSHLLDADKYGFLGGSAPQYSVHDTTGVGAADYSIVASAGRFDLAAGESQSASFAIVGGETLAHWMQNAEFAQLVYEYGPQSTPPADQITAAVRLLASRPNPLTRGTAIRFALPTPTEIDLAIFDLGGRRVRQLMAGLATAGVHDLIWDGRDERGRPVESGVYFVHLHAGRLAQSQRLVVVR